MKTLKYLFAAAFALSMVSCYNLDILPKDAIGEEVLLNSDYGIRKYLAVAYLQLPIEDFNFYVNGGYKPFGDGNRWEAQKNSPAQPGAEASGFFGGQYEGFDYWTNGNENSAWGRIRGLNNFLLAIPTYKDNFSEAEYNAYLAEARFLRAYYYFALAKFYGGVPLITETLDPTAPLETIQIARATEYDTWDFIYKDLQFAMENGSTDKSNTVGRANRYVAAALMSRAMLYAGSIAKYNQYASIPPGEATTLGLQGMPSEKAAEFFQRAYDAAKFVKDGGYALHTGGDKEKAFTEVFLNSTVEDIFVKEFGVPDNSSSRNTYLMNNWDSMVLPNATNLAQGPGAGICPSWDLIQLYDLPAIATDEEEPKPIFFDNIEDIWKSDQMEARLRATMYFPGMTETASGIVLQMQAGLYADYPGTVADGTAATSQSQNEYTNGLKPDGSIADANSGRRKKSSDPNQKFNINGVEYAAIGAHGTRVSGVETRSCTGTIIRKYVSNVATRRGLHQGNQPWKVIRYGEVLLNWAEAAYELGIETSDVSLKREAFTIIAELRERAGASARAMIENPVDVGMLPIEDGGLGYDIPIDENLQFIRDERARELAFENHRVYDLMRWRVSHRKFENHSLRALLAYYVVDRGQYIYLPEIDPNGRRVSFNKSRYYRQIPGGALEKNTMLIRNDGY